MSRRKKSEPDPRVQREKLFSRGVRLSQSTWDAFTALGQRLHVRGAAPIAATSYGMRYAAMIADHLNDETLDRIGLIVARLAAAGYTADRSPGVAVEWAIDTAAKLHDAALNETRPAASKRGGAGT